MRVPKFLIKFHQRIQNTRLWKLRWKILAVAPFILALGVFLFYTAYRILAEKTHQEFVTSWEAKGETMDIDTLFPPQGKPEDDFFSHPDVIAEISKPYGSRLSKLARSGISGLSSDTSDYINSAKGTYSMGIPLNIHTWLDPHEPTLTEKETAKKVLHLIDPLSVRLAPIIEASHRKAAWFPRSFDDTGQPTANTINHSLGIMYFSNLLGERAILHTIAGNENDAVIDLTTAIRIVQHARRDNSLLGHLFGVAQILTLEKPLWEGLKRHAWSETSLSTFETMLAPVDEQKRYFHCMRQEMAYTNLLIVSNHRDPSLLEKQKAVMTGLFGTTKKTWKDHARESWEKIRPRGWHLKRGSETMAINMRILFYPNNQKAEKLTMQMVKAFNNTEYPLHDQAWSVLTSGNNSMSFYASPILKALRAQAAVHNMRTAIALKRYRLKHNQYPATLNDLVPHFLPHVLEDVINGKPLNYRIKSDGTPLIYSIGSDEKDNGGDPHFDPEKGDWAWMYSPPAGFTYSDYKRR